MNSYLLRRFYLFVFIFMSLTVFSFSLSYLFPGDVLTNLSGQQNISPNNYEALEKTYHTNSHIVEQYFAYLGRIFQGDFGLSFSNQTGVFDQLLQVFPATIELSFYALLLSVIVGIPLGILAAAKKKKWQSQIIMSATLIGYSLPIFWWALLLIMVFSLQLGWLPLSGRISVLYEIPSTTGFMIPDIFLADINFTKDALYDAFKHLLLPTAILATYPTTVLIRFTRDSMLDVLETSYIKTARAKGLTRAQVLYRHGLRNALLPVIRQIGLQFSTLITLAMLTEVIFSWPGVGRWLITSIYQRDYPAIQGGLLLVSSFVIFASMLADGIYSVFNPINRKYQNG